ncbi:MAG: hypothetical protein ACKV1O_02870 [Saprospiraceae bacterium]
METQVRRSQKAAAQIGKLLLRRSITIIDKERRRFHIGSNAVSFLKLRNDVKFKTSTLLFNLKIVVMKQITFFVTLTLFSLTYTAHAKLILCKWDQQNVTNPPRCYEITALSVGSNGTLTVACCRHMIIAQSDNWWWDCVDDCPRALMGNNSNSEVEIKEGGLFLDGVKAA